MPTSAFLETYPLYRKFPVSFPGTLNEMEKPSVHMRCPVCESDQTFIMVNEYFELFPYTNYPAKGAVVHADYVCASCKQGRRYFVLKFDPEGGWVMKVGQEPPWEIAPDQALAEALGSRTKFYKRGLVCESQGYGLGAFAYYRRIVEEIIDELLAMVSDLLAGADREEYLEALERAKRTPVTQDKIAIVRDLMPQILRPDGMNPLSILHDALSMGLHKESDEDCLDKAMEIREVLVFLVTQITVVQRSSMSFTNGMRRLLDRRHKPRAEQESSS